MSNNEKFETDNFLGKAVAVDVAINFLKDYHAQLLCLCVMGNKDPKVREALGRINSTLAHENIQVFSGMMHFLRNTSVRVHYLSNVYENSSMDLRQWVSMANEIRKLLPGAKEEAQKTFDYVINAKKDNDAMPPIRQEHPFFGGLFGVDAVSYE